MGEEIGAEGIVVRRIGVAGMVQGIEGTDRLWLRLFCVVTFSYRPVLF